MLVEMSGSSDKTSGHVRRQGLRPLPLQGQLFIDGSTGSLRRVGRSSLLGILLTIIVALVNCYERDERNVLVPAYSVHGPLLAPDMFTRKLPHAAC